MNTAPPSGVGIGLGAGGAGGGLGGDGVAKVPMMSVAAPLGGPPMALPGGGEPGLPLSSASGGDMSHSVGVEVLPRGTGSWSVSHNDSDHERGADQRHDHGHDHGHDDGHGHSHSHGHQDDGHGHSHSHGHGGHGKKEEHGVSVSKLAKGVLRDVKSHGEARRLAGFGLLLAVSSVILTIFGSRSHNLCLVTLATHTASHTFAVVISLVSASLQKRSPSKLASYGFSRFQVMASFANGVFVLFVGLFLLFECLERFFSPELLEDAPGFTVVTLLGLMVNVSGVVLFRDVFTHKVRGERHDSASTNARAQQRNHQPFLAIPGVSPALVDELWVDVCTGVAAIVGQWASLSLQSKTLDPLLSIVSITVLMRDSIPVCSESGRVLLQALPITKSADISTALRDCALVDGVLEIRRPHFWTQSPGVFVGSLNIRVAPDFADSQRVLQQVGALFEPNVVSTMTIQIDRE
jgi:cobalt-zinc-cadmium efflux system protein